MSFPYYESGNINGTTIPLHDDAIILESGMIGVIISAIVYGGILALTLSYIPLLLKTSNDISRRMRIFLLVYVVLMVAISTVYIITIIVALTHSVFHPSSFQSEVYLFQNRLAGALCITFASWGADGFMLWRCAMLYQGVSRHNRIALIAVLVLMGIISFGSGLLYLARLTVFSTLFLPAMLAATVILNTVTATLITFRILYYYRYIRKTVGLERSNPYLTTIIICVESSMLIIVFSLIYLILGLTHSIKSYGPMQLLVHIYVLSPLLIVYRVAQGKAVGTVSQRPSKRGPDVSALHFQSQIVISSNSEV